MPAFAQGVGGQLVPPVTLLEGPAAMYGLLRGCSEIIKRCEDVKRDYYYIDHGYYQTSNHEKGDFGGYYRVVHNARQKPPKSADLGQKRFETLQADIRPWRRTGRHILLIPNTKPVSEFYGLPQQEWLATVVREIAAHTDRPIRIKEKGDGEISDALRDAWCLVTLQSNTAVDALLDGVPVITLGESAVSPLSWKFGHIENPYWPDREETLWGLAENQFTLEEMRSGLCKEVMGIE